MRFSVVALATAALTAPLVTLAAPAAATTECRDVDQGDTVVTRSCKVYSSRIGGLVEGRHLLELQARAARPER